MAIPALTSVAGFGAKTAGAAVLDRTGVIEVAGDSDVRLPLASVTKLLVAYAALVAVEEGTIALDDPVGPAGSSVAHLLAHASGLAPDDPTRSLAARPGTHRIYSSAGYAVLAPPHRAGERLHDRRALSPKRSSATADAPFRARRSGGDGCRLHCRGRHPVRRRAARAGADQPGDVRTGDDVAFPGLGGVLPGFGRQEPCDFGLGFEIRDHKAPHWTGSLNSPATFGHFGQSGTFLWVDPVAGLSLIVLTDRPFGDWAAAAWPPLSDEVVASYPGPH